MGENIPPTPALVNGMATTGSEQQAPARGIPYYEKLRRELRDTLQKKRLMDKNMAALEDSIYRFEQSYLEETGAGNIIKGFDHYIKGSSGTSNLGTGGGLGSSFSGGAGTGGPTTRRKTQVSEMDRVFSRSSASFMRDSPAPSSAHTTPSHAPTPSSSGPNANKGKDSKDRDNNSATGGGARANTSKKNKKAAMDGGRGRERETADDDGDSKQPVKRLKITYVRGE